MSFDHDFRCAVTANAKQDKRVRCFVADLDDTKRECICGRILEVESTERVKLGDSSGFRWFTLTAEWGVRHGDLVEAQVWAGHLTDIVIHQHFDVARIETRLGQAVYDPRRLKVLAYRSHALQSLRLFFINQGFLEVETPLLVNSPGLEPHLHAFSTTYVDYKNKKHHFYLPTSPEFAMKKLLVMGADRIFQLCKAFRNHGELAQAHQPEFTMLEWYRSYVDYTVLMDDVEALIQAMAVALGDAVVSTIKTLVRKPFQRLSVRQAFLRYTDVDLSECHDLEGMAFACRNHGCLPAVDDTWEDLFFRLFIAKVEPNLGHEAVTILYDYPAKLAALSTIDPKNPQVCQRFEVYIVGVELANAFNELCDADEQQRRFSDFSKQKKQLGYEQVAEDSEFIDGLHMGLPPSAGIALGFDRLLAVLLGYSRIDAVMALSMNLPLCDD